MEENTTKVLMDYNPNKQVNVEEWLSSDEDERLYAIQCWLSELTGSEIDECVATAVPILGIENQVALGDPPVTGATLDRLLEADIDRMTAIQVISEVLSDSLQATILAKKDFDSDAFAQALEQIDPADIALDYTTDKTPREPSSSVPEFSPEQRRVLIDFAERHADKQAMSWPETAGFLFAVMACPDMVMPSEWSEIVQGEAVFDDTEEAHAVTIARMALMNWISDCISQNRPAIPDDCQPDPEPLRILETDNNFARWCRGVTSGHNWLQLSWDEALEQDSHDDRALGIALILFTFFSNREMAERVVEEMAKQAGPEGMTLEEKATRFHQLIEQAALEYAAIGLEYRQMPSASAPRKPVRSKKIGRNQPCPCGSGKKYKKCCGRPGA
ncbi:MAG: YecA family protein [Wenzhouxiangella sp.]|nr:MAG: YecA family protein [Wenzhouxiangella sp.]